MAIIDFKFKDVKCPTCNNTMHCTGSESGYLISTKLTCDNEECNTTILITLLEKDKVYITSVNSKSN